MLFESSPLRGGSSSALAVKTFEIEITTRLHGVHRGLDDGVGGRERVSREAGAALAVRRRSLTERVGTGRRHVARVCRAGAFGAQEGDAP